jgi:DNA-binding CsgD family transcriptional regulator
MQLQEIFSTIRSATSRDELKGLASHMIASRFGASRHRILFFDDEPEGAKMLTKSGSAIGLHLLHEHSPVHEGQVMSAQAWLSRNSRHDHGHAMAGPIVGDGVIVGIVALTRTRDDKPFNESDVRDLGAICAHLSTWKGLLAPLGQLTAREHEIAVHVSHGRTNAEIGRIIGISENGVKQALKRIFRKCYVSSRTELAARL